MAKKREIPKINIVTFKYNGDQSAFEKFISNMAADYFNSDILPEYMQYDLVGLVEIPPENTLPLDN